MIAVIFEVKPAQGSRDAYLQIAAALRQELETMDGFLSIERFESHRAAQARGRNGLFADYRLRVAAVLRDYGMADRAAAPADSLERHGG
jgi:heme-degrading monooxygenase HmoA